ncbi:MAG TPA: protein kinase [Planctomycetota bacterium]|nr:protein kinase [Planctomycetota bacterium]
MAISSDTQVLSHRFGEIARELNLVTDDQIKAALEKQRSLKISGGKSRLGEVLIMMNVLNVEQVKKVLSEQRKRRTAEADKTLPMEYFGEYKLLEKLGEGGMGSVYKAQETLANRTVALKVLRKNLAGNQGFVERFTREAQLAGSLNHPNIVACHNAGTSRGVQFLVMEFVDGDTLKARLKREGGKIPEKESLRIIGDVAKGLAHAHSKGVVHRDIKPDNILLGKEGAVKISDFGTAKSFLDQESMTQTGVIIGTPHYISPEQVRADKDIDHRADLYALGGTLYQALTGRLPFDAPTALEIMRRHLQDELENPADLNPELSIGAVQIVTKLMAKAPNERYQSANELVEDIDRVLKGETPLHATLEQHKSSIRPPRKKAKKGASGCLGMVIFTAAGTLWLLA